MPRSNFQAQGAGKKIDILERKYYTDKGKTKVLSLQEQEEEEIEYSVSDIDTGRTAGVGYMRAAWLECLYEDRDGYGSHGSAAGGDGG